MKLLLDTSQTTFTVGSEPEPVVDFLTDAQCTNDQGRPIWAVQLVASFKDDRSGKLRSEIVNVKVAGELRSLPLGSPVRVTDMVAIPWVRNDRSEIAYRAAAIEPLSQPTPRAKLGCPGQQAGGLPAREGSRTGPVHTRGGCEGTLPLTPGPSPRGG